MKEAIPKLLREGLAFHSQGNLVFASGRYAMVRAIAPTCREAWHYGGMVALLEHKPAEAAALFEQALRLSPKAGESAVCLGVARIAMGDLAAAETALRRAVALGGTKNLAAPFCQPSELPVKVG